MNEQETMLFALEGGLRAHLCSRRGGRPTMEDAWLVVPQLTRTDDTNPGQDPRPSCSVLAVFDGHGGPQAAIHARKHLEDALTSSPGFWSINDDEVLHSLTNCFRWLHNDMAVHSTDWPARSDGSPSTSGTTASIVVMRSGKAYIAHVGDSRVVCGGENTSLSSRNKSSVLYESRDHRPKLENERRRVEAQGGSVLADSKGQSRVAWLMPDGRLVPFLNVSRSLGDFWSADAVSPEPELAIVRYGSDASRKLTCIVLATDGVWNSMTSAQVVERATWASSIVEQLDCDDVEHLAFYDPARVVVHDAMARCHPQHQDNAVAIVITFPPQLLEQPMGAMSPRALMASSQRSSQAELDQDTSRADTLSVSDDNVEETDMEQHEKEALYC